MNSLGDVLAAEHLAAQDGARAGALGQREEGTPQDGDAARHRPLPGAVGRRGFPGTRKDLVLGCCTRQPWWPQVLGGNRGAGSALTGTWQPRRRQERRGTAGLVHHPR